MNNEVDRRHFLSVAILAPVLAFQMSLGGFDLPKGGTRLKPPSNVTVEGYSESELVIYFTDEVKN
jgi:hypothetical protein